MLQCLCPALHNLLTDGLKPHQSDLIAGRRPNSAWGLVQATTKPGIQNPTVWTSGSRCCASVASAACLIMTNHVSYLYFPPHINPYLLILMLKVLNNMNQQDADIDWLMSAKASRQSIFPLTPTPFPLSLFCSLSPKVPKPKLYSTCKSEFVSCLSSERASTGSMRSSLVC